MGKKEYMEILLSQIRNDKAKELVGQEIEAHIDDQTEVYMEYGIDADTAEKKAVRSMGDPVETGASLDLIHKPKMSWGTIILIAVLSVFGLVIQGMSWMHAGELFFFQRQIVFVLVGFACMVFVCLIDYSRIVQQAKLLAVAYLVVIVLFALKSVYNNGMMWIHIGGISFSWYLIMYLSIPMFGILLYQYRKRERKYMFLPIAFMVFLLAVFYMISNSIVVFANIVLMAVIVFSFAIAKGWYLVKIKRFLTIFWICVIGGYVLTPILILSGARFAHGYRVERLAYFFDSNEGPYTVYGVFRPIRQILGDSQMLGGNQVDIAVSDANNILSDYVLLHMTASYGILITLAAVILLGFLCYKLFSMSVKQKNQAGMILGLSCGLIITVQIVEYIMMNFGLIPGTTVFLPLFSYGGSGTIVAYILLGLLLSIYRYQNLVTENRPKKRLVIRWEV